MTTDFTIREARRDDDSAVQLLAAINDTLVPAGRILVAEVDGEIQAAVAVAGGPPMTDSHRATAAMVSLLGVRAAQARALEDSSRRRQGQAQRRRARARGSVEALPYGFPRPMLCA